MFGNSRLGGDRDEKQAWKFLPFSFNRHQTILGGSDTSCPVQVEEGQGVQGRTRLVERVDWAACRAPGLHLLVPVTTLRFSCMDFCSGLAQRGRSQVLAAVPISGLVASDQHQACLGGGSVACLGAYEDYG